MREVLLIKRWGLALAASVASLVLASPVAAQSDYFRTLITSLLQGQHGYEDFARADIPDWIGELRRADQNRQVEVTIQLEAGKTYRVIGVCDNDCTNMDMEVFDAAGASVGINTSIDDHPYIEITPEVAGSYRVHPWVVECRARPCYGGVRVLMRQPRLRSGTAFLVSADGYLLTAAHVVERRENIRVHTPNGEVPVHVVARDPVNDVALLRGDLTGQPLALASARSVQRGQEVMTLGYPLVEMQGESQKATFGRSNALSGLEDDIRFMQMDATIQPGNSGGPLMSEDGHVVGIVTSTIDQSTVMAAAGTVAQNVNYALKLDYALPLLPEELLPAPGAGNANANFQETAAEAEASVFRISAE